jgi:glycosyltransferase involved in cell wall biosynthesis
VPEVHLNGLYAGAAAFGFPSRDEGFGLPVLEAMAQDTPVVCSDIPVLREVVGDAARLAPPDDIDAWSRALTDVLIDEKLRADLVARGRERVVAYSWDRCADKTAAVYREVLDITSRR